MLIEAAGAPCLVPGVQARAAALVMCVYLLAVTFVLHDLWAGGGAAAGMQ